jgi:hypothetical protein
MPKGVNVKELIQKQQEFSKVQSLLDENKYLKQMLKSMQRQGTVIEECAKIIEDTIPKASIKPCLLKTKSGTIQEDAILFLGDGHLDKTILYERVNKYERFNYLSALRRAERIVDVTTSHLFENLKGYEFNTLWVFMLGDWNAGDIHNLSKRTKWMNSIKSALAAGELLTCMMLDFSQFFKKINIISVSGNHGRRTEKKDYDGAHDNWDYLVAKEMETRLKGLIDAGRVSIQIPDSYSAGVTIKGWRFILNHGDDVVSTMGIPWYGLGRKSQALIALGAVKNEIPNYIVHGHFHGLHSDQITTGEMIINGAWVATDTYPINRFCGFREPYQILVGVHEKYGITWRMPIKLRVPNWLEEEKKPGRYKVKVVEDIQEFA